MNTPAVLHVCRIYIYVCIYILKYVSSCLCTVACGGEQLMSPALKDFSQPYVTYNSKIFHLIPKNPDVTVGQLAPGILHLYLSTPECKGVKECFYRM